MQSVTDFQKFEDVDVGGPFNSDADFQIFENVEADVQFISRADFHILKIVEVCVPFKLDVDIHLVDVGFRLQSDNEIRPDGSGRPFAKGRCHPPDGMRRLF